MLTGLRLALVLATGSAAAAAIALEAQQPATLSFKGTLVTPDTVIENGVVTVRGSRIASVGTTVPADAVDVDGVIFPGLIDLHNHLVWNALPNWTPPRKYTNRYEWQEEPEYAARLSGPYAQLMADGHGCDLNRYAEVKSLINGGTATVGGYAPTMQAPDRNGCIRGLVRNLDYASETTEPPSLNAELFRNFVFPLELSEADERVLRAIDPSGTTPGVIRGAVMHVAEGTDSAARRELRQLDSHGLLKRGVPVIHGVALPAAAYRMLAERGIEFAWSPHSNFILYGATADILGARSAGVTIALAPDWSPTGSAGMLEELRVASRYAAGALRGAIREAELVAWATSNPARLAAIHGALGTIEAGKAADFVVMKKSGASSYQALLSGDPDAVLLVVIGGQAVYGDRVLMRRLWPAGFLEDIDICGEPKALHIASTAGRDSWEELVQRLTTAMRALGIAPSALASC